MENVEYAIHNVLWLFERNYFSQYYYQFTGFDVTHTRAVNMTVNAGGSGYKIGDKFQVSGGTPVTPCQGIVIATNTGTGAGVLVTITNGGGSYSTFPSPATGLTTSNITGTGSGLTVDLTSGEGINLEQVVASEVYLGENVQQGYTVNWDNGQQITEIFNWMNITYNPTRHPDYPGYPGTIDTSQDVLIVGTIDPKSYLPTTRMNTIACMEALNVVLQADTDAVIVEDPTTSVSGNPIPTLHVRKLGKWNYATTPPAFVDYTNLTEVSVNITTDQEKEVIAQSTLSKVLPGVIIYYKWATIVDGVSSPHLAIDKCDSHGSALYVDGVKIYGGGSPVITDWTPEVSRHTYQLIGSNAAHSKAIVKGTPIALLFSNSSQWWGLHDRSLYGPEVPASSSIDAAQVVDENNNPIDTGVYAYELQSTLPDWISGNVVRATVRQHLFWTRKQRNYNFYTHISDEKPHTQRVQLTNVAPGSYSVLASASGGEPIPGSDGQFSLAESAYRSAAAKQFSGRIALVKSQLRADLRDTMLLPSGPNNVGFRIRLIGPHTDFGSPSGYSLLVQSIEDYPQAGKTIVTFGPVPYVDVDQWVTLARASRVRWSWTLPSGRGDGSGSGGGGSSGTVDLTADLELNNTSNLEGGMSLNAATHIVTAG